MSDKKNNIMIMVVDDEVVLLRTIKRILEKQDYSVITFENPALALEHLSHNPMNLILTDLKMPEMDGIQFLHQAKRLQPSVPIILMTAFATISTAVQAIQTGAFDYVRKPFEISKLNEVIKRALSSSVK